MGNSIVPDRIYKGIGIWWDIWGGIRCEINDAVFPNIKAVEKYIDDQYIKGNILDDDRGAG